MVLRKTDKYTYPSGKPRKFYGCSRWPECDGLIASHPNGKPMATPADEETRRMRQTAHRLAEQIWGDWDDPACKKKAMYRWLERHTQSGHIGRMQKQELLITIEKLHERIKRDKTK